VADQQQQRLPRRFFENLQKRVGGAPVHLLCSVDDHDAPPFFRCGQSEKAGDLACIFDHDLAAQPAASRIVSPLDG
jgi:hypothetical protein